MYTAEQEAEYRALTEQLLSTEQPTTLEQADHMVSDLRDAIRFHDWRYYIKSEAVISDFDYDKLFKMLKQIEEEYPSLQSPDSPTQQVALGLTEGFESVQHNVPMLSLDNSYNADDLKEFHERLVRIIGDQGIQYTVEPKYDGSSIAITYENDQLVRAATRGDGVSGEDITNNAKALRSIPRQANFSQYGIYKIEVRGEVVIPLEFFHQMNLDREEAGLKTFQNSRNTAAGTLRMKDANEVGKRGLEAILYQIGYAVDKDGNNLLGRELLSHLENIQLLGKLGFKVPTDEVQRFDDIAQVADFVKGWEDKRDDYGIEIDGMVVKLDDIQKQQETGATAHHPRWAIAYKFKAKQARSILERVEYQVGRTGAVTPVAKITPVPLAGVTISSISLHNADFIKEKDIMLGDTVLVERAGDVIPYITGVIASERDGSQTPIDFPTHCPSCESELVKPEGEAVWRCVNLTCPAQQEERIIHFVSKGSMDIEGLGKDIVKRFISEGIINHLADIYRLDYDKILTLEGWKERSVNKLRTGVEASKEQPTWRLMVALGIRHVGSTTAKQLAKQVKDLLDLKDWTEEQLTELEDIGPKVAESIAEFFHDPTNIDTIQQLAELGVRTTNPDDMGPKTNVLEGKTFLFTGTLEKFTRDQAKELVEENGGKLISGVSKKLNYLVAGPGAGSKLTKAEALGTVEVINEQDFLDMIGG